MSSSLPGAGEWGKRDVGQRVQTFGFKRNKFWGYNVQCDILVYLKVAKKVAMFSP